MAHTLTLVYTIYKAIKTPHLLKVIIYRVFCTKAVFIKGLCYYQKKSIAVGLLFGVAVSGFLVPGGVLAGELVGVFSTPWRGLCSGLKATRERPVGLTKMLLSVFLNSVR